MAGSFGDWLGTLKNTFKVGKATLSASGVATARTHTLPDAAGTVALTTDTYGGVVLQSHIAGLILSNNGTDATNDIDISTGSCADSTNTYLMQLGSVMTKQLDAVWAVGTNQGGLDTGTKAASTWYHVWLIRKDSDGSIDALFSTSVSAPTMPSGYTAKRLIGSVFNDSTNAIRSFKSFELGGGAIDTIWQVVTADDIFLTNTLGTTARLDAISVPLGYKTKATLNGLLFDGATSTVVYVSDPDNTDIAPSAGGPTIGNLRNVSSIQSLIVFYVYTNTSSQIRSRANQASVDIYRIATLGWEWGRR